MIAVCADSIDDVNDVSVNPVSAIIALCAADISLSVFEMIEVLAFVIASDIVCRFTAARAGVVVKSSAPLESSLRASAEIKD